MSNYSGGVSRSVITEFCEALGYEPEHVSRIEVSSSTVAVTSMPPGMTGATATTAVHLVDDMPYSELAREMRERECRRIDCGRGA